MTRRNTKSSTAVERLLEQQRQYQDWLDRLDEEARGGAPTHVAARVRADYAARLEEVTSELREHEDALQQALADARVRSEGLQKQHAERTDELAEARLRRQVGEFDEDKFEEVSVRCKSQLAELTKALASVDRDVERYEEILDQIQGEAEAPAAEDVAVVEEEVLEELVPEHEEPVPVEAPPPPTRPAPEADTRKAKPRQPAGDEDELAFLRSITGGEKEPAAEPPRRPASEAPAAPPVEEEPPAGPAAEAPPRPAPAPAPAPAAAPAPRAAEAPRGRRGAEGATPAGEGTPEARTLVCTECGAKNLPTEWYCEKCGAELSAF